MLQYWSCKSLRRFEFKCNTCSVLQNYRIIANSTKIIFALLRCPDPQMPGKRRFNSSLLWSMLEILLVRIHSRFLAKVTLARFRKTVKPFRAQSKHRLPLLVFQTIEFLGNCALALLLLLFNFCFEILLERVYIRCHAKRYCWNQWDSRTTKNARCVFFSILDSRDLQLRRWVPVILLCCDLCFTWLIWWVPTTFRYLYFEVWLL